MFRFLLVICLGLLSGVLLAPICLGVLYLLRPFMDRWRAAVHSRSSSKVSAGVPTVPVAEESIKGKSVSNATTRVSPEPALTEPLARSARLDPVASTAAAALLADTSAALDAATAAASTFTSGVVALLTDRAATLSAMEALTASISSGQPLLVLELGKQFDIQESVSKLLLEETARMNFSLSTHQMFDFFSTKGLKSIRLTEEAVAMQLDAYKSILEKSEGFKPAFPTFNLFDRFSVDFAGRVSSPSASRSFANQLQPIPQTRVFYRFGEPKFQPMELQLSPTPRDNAYLRAQRVVSGIERNEPAVEFQRRALEILGRQSQVSVIKTVSKTEP